MNTVNTNLVMKSTAQLNEEVLNELQIPDPDTESAKAILQNAEDEEEVGEDENPTGNDRSTGNSDNKEDS